MKFQLRKFQPRWPSLEAHLWFRGLCRFIFLFCPQKRVLLETMAENAKMTNMAEDKIEGLRMVAAPVIDSTKQCSLENSEIKVPILNWKN